MTTHTHTQEFKSKDVLKRFSNSRGWERNYLQVHLFEADEHPGNKALPEASRNKAHLYKPLECVVGLLAEAMKVHSWFVRKKVRQQIAT